MNIEVIETPHINELIESTDSIELCYEEPTQFTVKRIVSCIHTNQKNESLYPMEENEKEKFTFAEEKMEEAKEKIEEARNSMHNAQIEIMNAQKVIDNSISEMKNIKRKLILDNLLEMKRESKKVHKYLQENQENNKEILEKDTFMNFWNRPSEERLKISSKNYEHATKMIEYLEKDYQKYLEGLPISLKYSAIMMGMSKITIQSNEASYMNYLKQGFYMEDKEYKMTYIVDINTLNI
jgi:hypothetical protein